VNDLARRNFLVGVSVLLNLALAVVLVLILNVDKGDSRRPALARVEAKEQSVVLPPPPQVARVVKRAAPETVLHSPRPVSHTLMPPDSSPAHPTALKRALPDPKDPSNAPPPPDLVKPQIAGRVLLRQLEAGDGPGIEIAWPASQRERDALYKVFTRCYGMTTAILSDDGQIYRAIDPAGAAWRLNPDRYSGFLRQASGRVVPAERRELGQIRGRHRIGGGVPVRLFPRGVDAALLGGLQQLTGARFSPKAVIRARYRLSGQVVRVANVQSAGVKAPGEFDLRPSCID
jgi:hypothetical protein